MVKITDFTADTLPAAADVVAIVVDTGGSAITRKMTHDDLLFGANGTPSTQAHDDAAVIGTALDAARSDHKHAMPSDIRAFSLVGSQLTAATTTSTAPVDLLSASSLSIAVTNALQIQYAAYGSGGSYSGGMGLKINATVVGEASAYSSGPRSGWSKSSSLSAIGGMAIIWIPQRVTLYSGVQGGALGISSGMHSTADSYLFAPARTAGVPIATITDVIIRGHTENASITLGCDELLVFEMLNGA